VTREGKWLTGKNVVEGFKSNNYKGLTPVLLSTDATRELVVFESKTKISRKKIDVAFAWVLGPTGEDGTLQGLFEIADIPYVGCNVFASAAGFDKAKTKAVMAAAGIPQVAHVAFNKDDWKRDSKKISAEIFKKLGLPCFVKPASCGSSIGISKVKQKEKLAKAVQEALKYDRNIVVEKSVENLRELECAVLGTLDNLTVSLPGEVHYEGEFYDYHAKYVSEYWEIDIPPKMPKNKWEEIRTLARRVFNAIDGSGLARIDFLMDGKTGKLYFNELNTIPSFRRESCFATLMSKVNVSYKQIIDRLIEAAFIEHKRRQEKQLTTDLGAKWMKQQK
jgi:D-alanine-D-alanine ligase